MHNIPLFVANVEQYQLAQHYATLFQLPLIDSLPEHTTYFLSLTTQHLLLKNQQNLKQGAIYVDFISGKTRHRRLYGGGKNQPLAKAVGIKKDYRPTIIDATAGLGQDSFVLATLGCQVTLLERSPIIAALLYDGLQRAKQVDEITEIIQQLNLIHINSNNYLENLMTYPDTIYLDPMYPHRQKSALVKKEMRILRDIVGDNEDDEKLLNVALFRANKRVVVKRPKYADILGDIKPDFQIKSEKTRFDVYLT